MAPCQSDHRPIARAVRCAPDAWEAFERPASDRFRDPKASTRMPSIIITADTDSTRDFQLKERVRTSDLDNPHFSSQLIERIGWALADAEEAERAGEAAAWQPPT